MTWEILAQGVEEILGAGLGAHLGDHLLDVGRPSLCCSSRARRYFISLS